MRSFIHSVALLSLTASAAVAAQNPAGPPMPPMGNEGAPGGGRGAQMLLARSAELDLTDAQVVKLAAIARRAEVRRRAMRAAMDSDRTRFAGQPGDSVGRRQFAQRMQADMTKERDQARVDLRDAITVLTPDQQARAWEMAGNRARAMGGMGAGRRAPGQMRRGDRMRPGGQGGPGGRMRPARPPRPPIDGK